MSEEEKNKALRDAGELMICPKCRKPMKDNLHVHSPKTGKEIICLDCAGITLEEFRHLQSTTPVKHQKPTHASWPIDKPWPGKPETMSKHKLEMCIICGLILRDDRFEYRTRIPHIHGTDKCDRIYKDIKIHPAICAHHVGDFVDTLNTINPEHKQHAVTGSWNFGAEFNDSQVARAKLVTDYIVSILQYEVEQKKLRPRKLQKMLQEVPSMDPISTKDADPKSPDNPEQAKTADNPQGNPFKTVLPTEGKVSKEQIVQKIKEEAWEIIHATTEEETLKEFLDAVFMLEVGLNTSPEFRPLIERLSLAHAEKQKTRGRTNLPLIRSALQLPNIKVDTKPADTTAEADATQPTGQIQKQGNEVPMRKAVEPVDADTPADLNLVIKKDKDSELGYAPNPKPYWEGGK